MAGPELRLAFTLLQIPHSLQGKHGGLGKRPALSPRLPKEHVAALSQAWEASSACGEATRLHFEPPPCPAGALDAVGGGGPSRSQQVRRGRGRAPRSPFLRRKEVAENYSQGPFKN